MNFVYAIMMLLVGFEAQANLNKAIKINPDDPKLSWGPCPPIFPKTCSIAVLHGDPAKPNADILIKAKAGTKFPPHTHDSAERIILLSGELEVHYQDHEKQKMKKGDYAYGPAKLPHKAHCKKGPCLLFIAFEGPVNAEAFQGEI